MVVTPLYGGGITHVDLFSGIGGCSVAARWSGFETIAHCENDAFCQAVLAKNFPDVPVCEDVNEFTTWFVRRYGDTPIWLLTGGFPCQDISKANGRGEGLAGERSGLWFSMLGIVARFRPFYVVAENVGQLLHRGIDVCIAGLEAQGYAVQTFAVGASHVGAPHRRERIFIVAERGDVPDAYRAREPQSQGGIGDLGGWTVHGGQAYGEREFGGAEPGMGGSAPRLPGRMDRGERYIRFPAPKDEPQREYEPSRLIGQCSNREARLGSLGNTLVPQQVYPFLWAIMQRIETLSMNQDMKPLAASTIRAHAGIWARFAAWCETNGHDALPATPDTVVVYLRSLVGSVKVSTIERHLVTINQRHAVEGLEPPSAQGTKLRYAMQQMRRDHGEPATAKTALLTEDILRMVDAAPDTVGGIRDRLVLLLGFAMAARRSELVALNFGDVEEVKGQGLLITIRRSKTDQEGRGRQIGVPFGTRGAKYCPVRTFQEWKSAVSEQNATGAASGPVFLRMNSDNKIRLNARLESRAVWELVKRYAAKIGLDPARFGAHSLRSGLATSAAMNDASDRTIMNTTGHKSRKQLDRYVQEGSRWKHNAAREAGL